jgi:hypothetical protein
MCFGVVVRAILLIGQVSLERELEREEVLSGNCPIFRGSKKGNLYTCLTQPENSGIVSKVTETGYDEEFRQPFRFDGCVSG